MEYYIVKKDNQFYLDMFSDRQSEVVEKLSQMPDEFRKTAYVEKWNEQELLKHIMTWNITLVNKCAMLEARIEALEEVNNS